MLERGKIRPQNVVYKTHVLLELPPEQNRLGGSVPGEKTDHLPGRGMGPLPISFRVGEDHRQIKSSYDVRGPKYSWLTVDREMKSCRVGLAPRCHRVVELNDHPRVEKLTRCYEWLQGVLFH